MMMTMMMTATSPRGSEEEKNRTTLPNGTAKIVARLSRLRPAKGRQAAVEGADDDHRDGVDGQTMPA